MKNNLITLLSRFTFIPKTDIGLLKTENIFYCVCGKKTYLRQTRVARSAGRVKKKLLQNHLKFLCLLRRVYTIMQGHRNSPCFACGRVLDLQKHAKREFYEIMAKKSFLKLVIAVIWSVTPTFYFFYLFSSLERAQVWFLMKF